MRSAACRSDRSVLLSGRPHRSHRGGPTDSEARQPRLRDVALLALVVHVGVDLGSLRALMVVMDPGVVIDAGRCIVGDACLRGGAEA